MKFAHYKAVILSLFLASAVFSWHISNAQKKEINSARGQGETWAVVIGISKYKHIPGLNYADKDALAFYQYLNGYTQPRTATGHIKLLLNENALGADIYGALEWLAQSVKRNDRVIFYFSGHGDAEQSGTGKPGFLLAYDAPAETYVANGSVSTINLLKYFDRYLTVNNVSNVILIADACRAGELAGGQNGLQQTMQALNEGNDPRMVRILSAQQSERSYEGSKWGEGHGVFSYYLVRGLEGAADFNRDNHVTIDELNIYMHQTVGKATGYLQNPFISGAPKLTLFALNHATVLKADSDENISTVKGIDNEVTSKLNPQVKELYHKYLDYMQRGRLVYGMYLNDTINCAKYYYLQLVNNPKAISIRPSLCSSFIASLQHKAQSLLDDYVAMKPILYHTNEALEETNYALKLVKTDYILHDYLMARSWFLSAFVRPTDSHTPELLKKSLGYEPDLPITLDELGIYYAGRNEFDTANYYLQKAIQLAPKWPYPYNNLCFMYDREGDLKNAIKSSNMAIAADSTYGEAWYNLGLDYQKTGDTAHAMLCYKETLKYRPDIDYTYNNIGAIYHDRHEYLQAIAYYKQALKIDSNYVDGWYNIGESMDSLRNYGDAIYAYKRCLELDGTQSQACAMIGEDLYRLKHPNEAINYFQQCLKLDSNYTTAYDGFGRCAERMGNYGLAVVNYRKAVKLDTGNIIYRVRLSYALIKSNKAEEGKSVLSKVCDLDSLKKNADCCYAIARAWIAANQKNKAKVYLQLALSKGFQADEQLLKDDGLDKICSERKLKKWQRTQIKI